MRRTLALLLLMACPALADAPKASIKGPARVAPESTIVLDARGSVADRPLRWKLEGPDVPFLTLDQDGRTGVVALVPSAPAGVYKFTLIARGIPEGEAELDADAAILVVTVEGGPAPAPPTPPPNPTPTPTPAPDDKPRPPPAPDDPPAPAPIAGTLNVSLVVDLEAMTPAVARLREGTNAREAFGPLDTVYRTYAITSPDAARLNLATLAQRAGLPAVVVQDQAGRVLYSGRAPPDEAGLIQLVKTFRGAN